MKRIGLVTWYDRGPNYGTSLQAYALQKYIKSLNYDCFIINYDGKSFNKKIKFFLIEIYFYFFNHSIYKKRRKMKKWIYSNIELTEKKYDFNTIKKEEYLFDSFVCGSDQIWSTAEEIIDPFYYLQFTNINKRVSYAPSIGKNMIGKSVQNIFIEYIQNFNYLSIRETTGSNIIEKLINRKPLVVVDPTLLFNKDEWVNLLNIKKKKNKKTVVFAYFLSENKKYFDDIVRFVNDNDFVLHTTVENYDDFGKALVLNSKEFLEELFNSDFIVTDSFHGMIFSIIFNKNFVVFKRFKDSEKMNQNSRVVDFLNDIKLSSRIYDNNLDVLFHNQVDYSIAFLIINELINKSKDYLKQSLNDSILKNDNR